MTREEAIEHFVEQLDIFGGKHAEAMRVAIEALQTDLVRCKDCRYYNNDYMGEWCGRHQAPVWVKEDDFCSWGERREDGKISNT